MRFGLDFWLLHRRFAGWQIDFQIIHHLWRGDDENDQQHEHEVEQRRDVQFVQRTVLRARCLFQTHCNTGSVCSCTSKRMVTRGGKLVGGGRSMFLTTLKTCLTVASHLSSPEPLSQVEFSMLPLPVHAHGNFSDKISSALVSGRFHFYATHIPYNLCIVARDQSWSRRPCRRQIQTTALRCSAAQPPAVRQQAALALLALLQFWVFQFSAARPSAVRFWGFWRLGFFRRLFLDHLHGDLVQFFPEQPFARRKIKQHQHQDGVERERNHQVHSRRVLCFARFGLRQHFISTGRSPNPLLARSPAGRHPARRGFVYILYARRRAR